MPKQKVRKAILRRFKVTKKGKVLRGTHGSQHRMSHKSGGQIRRFKRPQRLSNKMGTVVKSLI